MANVINVFLGGTGKHIAALIKGRSAFYGWTPAPMLVFDTDPSEALSGRFSLNDELHAPEASFPDELRKAIYAWAAEDATTIKDRVDRGQRFDTAVAPYKAALDLRTANAPAGGGLWSLRTHGPPALGVHLALYEQADGFFRTLKDLITAAGRDGASVRVNIACSIAGGTGSGLFLPIALKAKAIARDIGQGMSIETSLFLVLPTAFYADWGPAQGDAARTITRTRGLSGAFAAWREVGFFASAGGEIGATLRTRTLPLVNDSAVPGLQYRPASDVTNKVSWFGHRRADHTRPVRDLFHEVSRLIAVLSDPQIDQALTPQAAMGAGPAPGQLAWSAVSVEYPLLELAQRNSAYVVAEALSALRGPEDDQKVAVSVYDHWSNESLPLSQFLHTARSNVLAEGKHPDRDLARIDQVTAFVEAGSLGAARAKGYQISEPRTIGMQYGKGGYVVSDMDWEERTTNLVDGLQRDLEDDSRSVGTAMNGDPASGASGWLDEEIATLNEWIRVAVVEEGVNGGPMKPPRSLAAALNAIGSPGSPRPTQGTLLHELERVRQLFLRHYTTVVPQSEKSARRFKGATQCREDFTKLTENLKKSIAPETRVIWELWWAALALSFFAGLGAGAVLVYLQVDPVGALIVGLVVALVAALGLSRLRPTEEELLERRRKKAEELVFEAFEDLRFARCAEMLWGPSDGVEAGFLTPLIGARDEAAQAGTLTGTQTALRDAREVCQKAADQASAEANLELTKSPDVADWVGLRDTAPSKALNAQPDAMKGHVAALRLKLRVGGIGTGTGRSVEGLELTVGAGEQPSTFRARQLKSSIAENAAATNKELGELWGKFTQAVADEAWGQVKTDVGRRATLRQQLFKDAGKIEERAARDLAAYLDTLVERADERSAAISADAAVGVPQKQLLVVPDEMATYVSRALPQTETRTQDVLRNACENGNIPYRSSATGQAILLVSMYVLPDLDRVTDLVDAKTAYYRDDDRQRDRDNNLIHYSQARFQFHVLPELSAAAAVEIDQRLGRPLARAVTARLLGSDPAYPGPTLLELFYLARAAARLDREEEYAGADLLRTVWRLHGTEPKAGPQEKEAPAADRVKSERSGPAATQDSPIDLLVEPALVDAREAGFRAYVPVLDVFDAFCDFMSYDGGDRAGVVSQLASTSVVCLDRWRQLPQARRRSVQKSIRDLWWSLRGHANLAARTSKYTAMRDLLDEDFDEASERLPADLREDWRAACGAVFTAGDKKLSGR